jgi:hypothetical protein
MDYSPILMDDATNGRWESAFITSSSRLIYPISRILIPEVSKDDGNDDINNDSAVVFREFWSDRALVDENQEPSTTPRWLDLLNELIVKGGYDATNESETETTLS